MDTNERQCLKRILESAVVVSWADLVRNAQVGLIQIEYGFAAGGTYRLPEVLDINKPRSFVLAQREMEKRRSPLV
jgi:hypothetical protein